MYIQIASCNGIILLATRNSYKIESVMEILLRFQMSNTLLFKKAALAKISSYFV